MALRCLAIMLHSVQSGPSKVISSCLAAVLTLHHCLRSHRFIIRRYCCIKRVPRCTLSVFCGAASLPAGRGKTTENVAATDNELRKMLDSHMEVTTRWLSVTRLWTLGSHGALSGARSVMRPHARVGIFPHMVHNDPPRTTGVAGPKVESP